MRPEDPTNDEPEEVSASAQESAAAAQQVAASAAELSTSADSLGQLVARFKLSS